jgi:hypothetical protein
MVILAALAAAGEERRPPDDRPAMGKTRDRAARRAMSSARPGSHNVGLVLK